MSFSNTHHDRKSILIALATGLLALMVTIVVYAAPPPPPATPPEPAAPPQPITVSLSASPSQGYAPLVVALTAHETGGTTGGNPISYLFNCNSGAAGTSVTNTPSGTCTYQTPGSYTPDVIAEQNGVPVAQAQATVTATYPPTVGGGNGGGYVGPPTPAPPPVTQSSIITNVIISQPASSSVVITVETNKPASVYLKWGETTTYGSVTNWSPYLTTIYEELSNLTPATAYDFMVFAVPQGGATISSSPNYVFITAPGIAATLNPIATSTQTFFPRNISLNMTGPDVLSLTTVLGNLGYNVTPMSTFTAQASHALLLFQYDHNLNESGYLDLQTQALMEKIVNGNPGLLQPHTSSNPALTGLPASPAATPTQTTNVGSGAFTEVLNYGSRGAQVIALQNFLTKNSDYTGPITGFFGPLTRTGVMVFQGKYGIINYGDWITTGYGMVGPKTRAKLNQLEFAQ